MKLELEQVEPVAKIIRNAAGQISIQTPYGEPFDMSKHIGAIFYTASQPAAAIEERTSACLRWMDGISTERIERALGRGQTQLSRDLENAQPAPAVPEGWMRDAEQVEELAEHLERLGWTVDARGDAQCNDQGAAMAAEVIRKILQPMLAAAPSPTGPDNPEQPK